MDQAHLLAGGLALLLALATAGFALANSSLQGVAAAGQAKVAGAQTAANVNASLIRLLAKSAAENNDEALKALLARNGITFNAASKGPGSPAVPVAQPTPQGF